MGQYTERAVTNPEKYMNTKHTDSVEALVEELASQLKDDFLEYDCLVQDEQPTRKRGVDDEAQKRLIIRKIITALQATQKPQTTDSVEAIMKEFDELPFRVMTPINQEMMWGEVIGLEADGMMQLKHWLREKLTTLKATQSQQVEEAVRKTVDKTRVLVRKYGTRMTDGEFKAFMKELSALTPNHQD